MDSGGHKNETDSDSGKIILKELSLFTPMEQTFLISIQRQYIREQIVPSTVEYIVGIITLEDL